MKLGIVFFSLVKTFQGKPKPKDNPENYLLISHDEVLREKLEYQFKKSVRLQNISETLIENGKAEIILDQNYFDFKAIISVFEANKNKGFSFKIRPVDCDFLIGSNSSYDRGEIIKISNL
jgi:hypothetical protein